MNLKCFIIFIFLNDKLFLLLFFTTVRFNVLVIFGPVSYQCDSTVIGIREISEIFENELLRH